MLSALRPYYYERRKGLSCKTDFMTVFVTKLHHETLIIIELSYWTVFISSFGKALS